MYLIHVINRLYAHTTLYKVTYKSSQKAHLIAVNGRRSKGQRRYQHSQGIGERMIEETPA